jgi:hypothetical protein
VTTAAPANDCSAELDLDTNAQEVITGLRATARIKADRAQYEEALRPASGDFGPVEVMLESQAWRPVRPYFSARASMTVWNRRGSK